MELLNLDALVTPKNTIKFQKKSHEILPMTVGSFLMLEKIRKESESGKELDASAQLQQYIELIRVMIPTMPEKALYQLDLERINLLVEALMKTYNEVNEDELADADKEMGKA